MQKSKCQIVKKDPVILEALLKMLPPSSKVKNYLKESQSHINATNFRPISAGQTMSAEKIKSELSLAANRSTDCRYRRSVSMDTKRSLPSELDQIDSPKLAPGQSLNETIVLKTKQRLDLISSDDTSPLSKLSLASSSK